MFLAIGITVTVSPCSRMARAAAKLGLDPENCAVVEDAEAGIEAAKASGMTAYAVGDARKSPLADGRLDDIRQLLNQWS